MSHGQVGRDNDNFEREHHFSTSAAHTFVAAEWRQGWVGLDWYSAKLNHTAWPCQPSDELYVKARLKCSIKEDVKENTPPVAGIFLASQPLAMIESCFDRPHHLLG